MSFCNDWFLKLQDLGKDEDEFMKKILNIVVSPKKSPSSEYFTRFTFFMLKMVFKIDRGHKMTIGRQKGAWCEELGQ
jgi:hypothetical protein